MLLCDDEPSPVSSDEVFFICEKQTSLDRDDGKSSDKRENDSIGDNKSDCDDAKHRKTVSNRINRIIGNNKSIDISNSTIAKSNEDTIIDTDSRVKEAGCQTSHTILVKIQVENCSQCPEKSISRYSHDGPSTNKENTCKMKKKTVAVQVNFNSIESVVESHCVKISKVRCCNKAALLKNIGKTGKKSNDEAIAETNIENDDNKVTNDSTKIYLWSGKSAKKKQQQASTLLKSNSVTEKPKTNSTSNQRFTIHEPLQKSHSLVEKTSSSVKCRKPPVGYSPMRKLNRSSLTIEPDKITINLSKYSPCASRLAASSKILSSSSPLSPDSPLHGVQSRSPRRQDAMTNIPNSDTTRQPEKTTLQASLSLNIQQYQKSHPAPRSRSVGDSCVTSPTSEATTLSYSPTGTEILSLEEVGPQITVNEPQLDDSIMVLQKPEIKDRLNEDYLVCSRKANLETKC